MRGRHQKSDRISTLPSDRISALPQDTIEKILTHMPIKDALRTSILSKRWRYCWTTMPKLVFDDYLLGVSYLLEELEKSKIVNAIFHVLLLHRGPISELCLRIIYANIVDEIAQIILHLSWTKNIKKFTCECAPDGYKLPSSFFTLQGLEYLELISCKFELPLLFNGFSMLKTLIFEDVMITANTLQRFLTNCPLLEEFSLIETGEGILMQIQTGEVEIMLGNEFKFVDLFKCLPSIRFLKITKSYMERFAAGGMPLRLPASLPQLKSLLLDVCFQKQDEVSSALCVINSSPNLQNISIKMLCNGDKTSNNLLDLQDYSGLNLGYLKELKITAFHNFAHEMEFVKLIMAKSPVLEKARIEFHASVSVYEENKMLRDLLQVPLPRASPAVNFIIKHPNY